MKALKRSAGRAWERSRTVSRDSLDFRWIRVKIRVGRTYDSRIEVGRLRSEALATPEEVIRSEAALVYVPPLLQAHRLPLLPAQALQAAQLIIALPRLVRLRIVGLRRHAFRLSSFARF
jgi:hypothetical protein